jgi:hypothetical protein
MGEGGDEGEAGGDAPNPNAETSGEGGGEDHQKRNSKRLSKQKRNSGEKRKSGDKRNSGEKRKSGDKGRKSLEKEGEGKEVPKPFSIMDKTPQQEFEEKLANRMDELIEEELGAESKNQMVVTPMWRVVQITGLQTPWLDETVPPPPIPESPKPLIEPKIEEGGGDGRKDLSCLDKDDEEAMALVAARDHVIGDPYTGQGTCQLNLANINWPDDCPPLIPMKCSQMSFSNLDDLKNIVQSVLDKPLEPLDFEKIVAQNL